MQDEVEGDLGERCIQVACAHFRRVGGAAHFRDQTITRGKGEVVVQVFVAINVDLRRQLPIAQCADEEVDVRGAPSVPAELVEQCLRRPVRRAGITRGQHRAEPIAALGIGLDTAAEIVFWLGRVEEGIAAERVGVPDVDDRASHRLAAYVAHLAVYEQHFALLAAVVEPCFPLRERCARDVERTLDGARGAALDARLALRRVRAKVEKGFEAEAGHQQADLVPLAELGQVTHRRPELVRLDVELLDRLEQVRHDAVDDALQPSIALVVTETADLSQEVPHFRGLE
jgi:hypothetical protein